MRLHLIHLEARDTPATLPTGYYEVPIAEGLQAAAGYTVAPNGDAWVFEQTGTVKRFRVGSTTADVVLSIPVDSTGERGLLNGLITGQSTGANTALYVYHTVPAAGGAPAFNRVSRFTVNTDNANDYTVDLSTQFVLLDLDPLGSATIHNGGGLQLAPGGSQNALFVSVGDNGNTANSQSLDNRFGKVLRINFDGTIPVDNPTAFDGVAGTTSGVNRAIYAIGLRNPYRIAFGVVFSPPIWFVNDVGGSQFEEINQLLGGGRNYGWPLTEGPLPAGVSGVTYPTYSYGHGTDPLQGVAITGGGFYPLLQHPNLYPGLYPGYGNAYFFADFGGRIFARNHTSGAVTTFADSAGQVVDLQVNGLNVQYLDRQSGRLMEVRYDPTAPRVTGLTAVGSGPGVAAQVIVRNADGSTRFTLAPFGGFAGGVTVAIGDVTFDGSDDIVVGAGPGGGPHVKTFDGKTGAEVGSFFAFSEQFTGGVSVAVGPVIERGLNRIVAAAGPGGGPHVIVYEKGGAVQQGLFAYDAAFTGGVSVAVGDVDGDGDAELITGAGPGGGPHVKAFRLNGTTTTEVRSFYAFDIGFTGGVNVAAGETDGDTVAEIIAAPAIGGNAVVRVFRAAETVSVAAFSPAFLGGVRLSYRNGVLWVGAGPGGGPHVRGLAGPLFNEVSSTYAFDPGFTGGVFVG